VVVVKANLELEETGLLELLTLAVVVEAAANILVL
tara:strand:+ start:770 stop:874 length:105 start_codon:yes stop_codon:yes gene_type:complete